MITFKPIIIQGGRRKDGTWPVKIRVTFKGASRRLPTTLVCRDGDLTRGGRIKNGTVLTNAGDLIGRMRQACAALSPFTLEAWTVDDVVAHIRSTLETEAFRLDFFTFAEGFVSGKASSQTRAAYGIALNSFARFLGGRSIDVNEITHQKVLDYAAWVEAQPRLHRRKDGRVVETARPKVPGGASSVYVARLAAIYKEARWRYNDEDAGRILIPRSPFDRVRKSYPPSQGQKPLDVAVMQRLIDAKPEGDMIRRARALFLLSFLTMGANVADLYAARCPVGEVWTYNRSKTAPRRADRAEVRVCLLPETKPFLRELGASDGPAGRWLTDMARWKDANTATAVVNKGLRRWCEAEGLEPFTFYAARKSFATYARRLGVEKATVDEALAHVGDFRVADIYAARNWGLAWDAMRKVAAMFSWPDG